MLASESQKLTEILLNLKKKYRVRERENKYTLIAKIVENIKVERINKT